MAAGARWAAGAHFGPALGGSAEWQVYKMRRPLSRWVSGEGRPIGHPPPRVRGGGTNAASFLAGKRVSEDSASS